VDSQTHIELALKFVNSLGARREMAVAALFPQIDRYPPTLHRLFAHSVFKALPITRFGLRVLSRSSLVDSERATFEYRRFTSESPRFQSYLERFSSHAVVYSPEGESAALVAFVSHLYLDTFNQPTQSFAPLSNYCSGQWRLWDKLGDFRLPLYTTSRIERLRGELMHHAIWGGMPAVAWSSWVEAMMVRMVALSDGKIPMEIVELGLAAMGVERQEGTPGSDAVHWLMELERILCELHEDHLAGIQDPPEKLAQPLLA